MNSLVAVPIAAALPATAAVMPFPAVHSRAIEAVARVRNTSKLFNRLYERHSDAEDDAADTHGHRPSPLIAWRNYSHIGAGEIERARREFIEGGEDPAVIEREYRDAKKRYRAIIKAGKDWDKRAGLHALSQEVALARAEMECCEKTLATVELESVADASAILDLVYARIKKFADLAPWELAALGNATGFLSRLSATESVTA